MIGIHIFFHYPSFLAGCRFIESYISFRILLLFGFLLFALVLPKASVAGPTTTNERPIIAVWRPPTHRLQQSRASLRFAVWSDGRVAFSSPFGSFSEDVLEWGVLPPLAVMELKKNVLETGVGELKRMKYALFGSQPIRMLLRVDSQDLELVWDELDSPASAYEDDANEYEQFKNVWIKINMLINELLPSNTVTSRREWRGGIGQSGCK